MDETLKFDEVIDAVNEDGIDEKNYPFHKTYIVIEKDGERKFFEVAEIEVDHEAQEIYFLVGAESNL